MSDALQRRKSPVRRDNRGAAIEATYSVGEFDIQILSAEQSNALAVFLEYAWDINWCDPCAADTLSDRELRDLGVFWLDRAEPRRGPKGTARAVFVTRLHVRYDAEHFPADLVFQQTGARQNFQGRYVIRPALRRAGNLQSGQPVP